MTLDGILIAVTKDEINSCSLPMVLLINVWNIGFAGIFQPGSLP